MAPSVRSLSDDRADAGAMISTIEKTVIPQDRHLAIGSLVFDGIDQIDLTGSFEVLWNGTVVASFNNTGTAMLPASILVTAEAGSNRLGFRGTGSQDEFGASIDNVRLSRAQSVASNAIGNDILSGAKSLLNYFTSFLT